jgi:hypothetical protein
MRMVFLVLVLIHGLIHIFGFLKAFDLVDLNELTIPVTRPAGFIWLVASILFLTYGILNFTEVKNVWIIGFIAVLLSQFLVIYYWRDAKFATIPNIIILVAVLFSYSNRVFENLIYKEASGLLSEIRYDNPAILAENDIRHLPPPVQKWLLNSGALGQSIILNGRVEQKILMKMKPDQKNWYPAKAIQYTFIDKPAFIWGVDVEMNTLMKFKGRDKFVDGKGEMLIKMNSLIKIVDEQGEKMDEGTIQRFLGELVWFPSLAISPYITWEEIDEYSAKATMNYKNTSGSGTFVFNENGEFVKFTTLRYNGNEPGAKRKEWVLTVDDYAVFENIKMPSKMKATWKLDEGDWTWLDLEIADIRYNENARDINIQ